MRPPAGAPVRVHAPREATFPADAARDAVRDVEVRLTRGRRSDDVVGDRRPRVPSGAGGRRRGVAPPVPAAPAVDIPDRVAIDEDAGARGRDDPRARPAVPPPSSRAARVLDPVPPPPPRDPV